MSLMVSYTFESKEQYLEEAVAYIKSWENGGAVRPFFY